jgi:hypothetical protein
MMSFTFKRTRYILVVVSLGLTAGSRVLAQDVRVETQQQARARAENLPEEEQAPEDVADPDLGEINLVSRTPRPKMFTFSTVQTLNYTNNAFLVRDGVQDDFFWNGGVGASFVPFATRNFTPRLTFNQSWFRYNDFSQLDFDAQSLTLDLKYDLNRDDTWFINWSYTAARLESPDDSIGEFYRYGFVNASITHLAKVGTAPINLSMTGGAYGRHGDPSFSDRVAGYLSVAAIYNVCETVQLWGFTRPEVQHYTHDASGRSRDDFNLTVGAMLSWTPNQYVTVAGTASYIGNFSTVGERRYDLVTPSLVFAAQIAF